MNHCKRSGCVLPGVEGKPGYTIDGAPIPCQITKDCKLGKFNQEVLDGLQNIRSKLLGNK